MHIVFVTGITIIEGGLYASKRMERDQLYAAREPSGARVHKEESEKNRIRQYPAVNVDFVFIAMKTAAC
jgi:hypothetical protein